MDFPLANRCAVLMPGRFSSGICRVFECFEYYIFGVHWAGLTNQINGIRPKNYADYDFAGYGLCLLSKGERFQERGGRLWPGERHYVR